MKEDEKLLLLSSIFDDEDIGEELKKIQYDKLVGSYLLKKLKGDNYKIRSLFIYNMEKYGLYNNLPLEIQDFMNTGKINLSDLSRKKKEIQLISEQLAEAEYSVVLLKGIGMAETVYRSRPDVRDFNDIDILVRREEADEVYAFLQNKMQYQCSAGSAEQKIYKVHFQHYAPIQRDGIYVEMHHRLTQKDDPYTINEDRIINNAVTILLDGIPVKIPDRVDMLISLTYHMFQHEYREARFMLKPYSDIYNFVYHYKNAFDWNLFIERVKEDNIQFPVTYSLYFVDELFSQILGRHIIPENIFQNLMPKDFHEQKDLIVSRHLHNQDTAIGMWPFTHTERVFMELKALRRELCKQFFFFYSEEKWRKECKELGIEFCDSFEFSPRIWDKYGRV